MQITTLFLSGVGPDHSEWSKQEVPLNALNRAGDWHLWLIVTKVWTHQENIKLKHLT